MRYAWRFRNAEAKFQLVTESNQLNGVLTLPQRIAGAIACNWQIGQKRAL